MKTFRGLTLDHVGTTATISKGFAKAMNDPKSEEYRAIQHWRSEGYTIHAKTIKKNANKVKHTGLTIKFMERFMKLNQNNTVILQSFCREKATFKGQPDYYARMKAWFLRQFPEMTAEARRAKHRILTIEFMDDYIQNHDYATALTAEYTKIKKRYANHKDNLAMIKEWFINKFNTVSSEDFKMEMDAEKAMIELLDSLETAKTEERGTSE
ncbi:MAG: hypothetical protein FWC89_00685 [Defluviitaleaceae bacterium]|nr:hypothetical protein [Defluviitaleaceae bacterium]